MTVQENEADSRPVCVFVWLQDGVPRPSEGAAIWEHADISPQRLEERKEPGAFRLGSSPSLQPQVCRPQQSLHLSMSWFVCILLADSRGARDFRWFQWCSTSPKVGGLTTVSKWQWSDCNLGRCPPDLSNKDSSLLTSDREELSTELGLQILQTATFLWPEQAKAISGHLTTILSQTYVIFKIVSVHPLCPVECCHFFPYPRPWFVTHI